MNSQFIPRDLNDIERNIFQIQNKSQFETLALKVFSFQYKENPVYREYCDLVKRTPENVEQSTDIPFLPIELFKSHTILTGSQDYELLFQSSGTTGQERSRHFLKKASLYRSSFLQGFRRFYGAPEEFCILALLPNYMENKHSSLIYMVNELVQQSGHEESGFYLDNLEELANNLIKLKNQQTKILLLGVSYALLDLAEKFPMDLSNVIIMETGGMKGRREELTREELHDILKKQFQAERIHSEYGMAELLSQAYSKSDGLFETPPWMQIFLREYNDPFCVQKATAQTNHGGINVIDLANLYSCSFIETKDIGKTYPDGRFEVLGRFDYSDIRGCNLMVME